MPSATSVAVRPSARPAAYTTADIRNVLVAGHLASGKTSLVEALLHAGGALTTKGDVTKGTTASDFEKDEKTHGHSIHTAIVAVDHLGKRINLIDSPGSPELLGSALSCMAAVETVMVVVSAIGGIEVGTRRMMEAARERDLPRAIVINKFETPGVDLQALVAQIQDAFGPECLPVNLPAADGKVIDCLLNHEGSAAAGFDVAASHRAIVEQIVELDETLMDQYLGGEEPNFDALHAPFERCMDEAHLVPILFASAATGAGVPELLEFVARWFPSPLEGNRRPMVMDQGSEQRDYPYEEDVNAPLLAHVFKTVSDPFAGKLSIFRVHSGRVTGQSQVIVGNTKKPAKLGHVFTLFGKTHHEVNEIIAGDIGAVAKLEELRRGDVLHDDHALDRVHMRAESIPEPMHMLAIAPRTHGDEGKLNAMLDRLAEEDPSFRWTIDRNTHEVVISGAGELHLRLVLEQFESRGVHVDARQPRVAYRETIRGKAEGHHRHRKQSGGSGQFGEVFLRVEPIEASSPSHTLNGGEGFEFVDEIFGGSIPGQYLPAVEKGVRDVMTSGAIAGHSLANVRCIVYDGKHHPVDSKEIAFRTAGKWAFIDAVKKADPCLLEPIVKLEVTAPEEKLGAITGDLSSRRGRIVTTEPQADGMTRIEALAPLSELLAYNAQLKSVTGGRGSYSMTPGHHEPAPASVQAAQIAAWKPHVEET